MIAERAFPSQPESVPAARHFVAEALPNASKELLDRVALMVSEMATNAIQHAGTDFVVRVDADEDRLTVEVLDSGAGRPAIRSPTSLDRSGRGLRIVDVLADEWGVRDGTLGPDGKTVWIAVSLRGERADPAG